MKKCLAILLCLTLCVTCGAASAQGVDCFRMAVDALDLTRLNQDDYVAQYLSAQSPGLRVTKVVSETAEGAQPVRLSLVEMINKTLVFDRDYGYQSGVFDSGDIYLPYLGNYTVPYLVTLYVGDMVYAIPFMQLQSRLFSNGACTYGLRLYDLSPLLTRDWHMATMLDLNALRYQGSMAVDICASNAYLIGRANLTMQGDSLCVQLELFRNADAEVLSQSVYVVTDCNALTSVAPERIGVPAYQPGEWIYVGDAATALLYLPMVVSYDPTGLSTFGYDPARGYLLEQQALWQQNLASAYANTPVEPDEPFGDDSGWFPPVEEDPWLDDSSSPPEESDWSDPSAEGFESLGW